MVLIIDKNIFFWLLCCCVCVRVYVVVFEGRICRGFGRSLCISLVEGESSVGCCVFRSSKGSLAGVAWVLGWFVSRGIMCIGLVGVERPCPGLVFLFVYGSGFFYGSGFVSGWFSLACLD